MQIEIGGGFQETAALLKKYNPGPWNGKTLMEIENKLMKEAGHMAEQANEIIGKPEDLGRSFTMETAGYGIRVAHCKSGDDEPTLQVQVYIVPEILLLGENLENL